MLSTFGSVSNGPDRPLFRGLPMFGRTVPIPG
jgi:hypothetical protein